MDRPRPDSATDAAAPIAQAAASRRAWQAVALPGYPGRAARRPGRRLRLPGRTPSRCGRTAIVGWKVGYIAGRQRRDASGDERLVGPIFSRAVWPGSRRGARRSRCSSAVSRRSKPSTCSAWRADAPAGKTDCSARGGRCAGRRAARRRRDSPAARWRPINVLGPAVVVSDFGNNAGLILGPGDSGLAPRGRRRADLRDLHRRRVGRHAAAPLPMPGGLLAALAFALGRAARGAACRCRPACWSPPAPPPASTTSSPASTRASSFGGWSANRMPTPCTPRPGQRIARMSIDATSWPVLGAAARAARLAPRALARRAARVLTATDVHVKDYPTVAGGALDRRAARARNRRPPAHAACTTPASSAANPKPIDMARFGAIDITRVYTGALNNAFPLTAGAVPALRVRFGARTCAARIDGDVGARVLARLRSARPGRPGDLRLRRALLLQHAPADRARRPTCTA